MFWNIQICTASDCMLTPDFLQREGNETMTLNIPQNTFIVEQKLGHLSFSELSLYVGYKSYMINTHRVNDFFVKEKVLICVNETVML